jgi:hypothetical protein
VWAHHAPDSEAASASAAEAASAEADAAKAKAVAADAAVKLAVAKQRVERYASMTASEDALMAALLPCGKKEYPEQKVTGEKTFKCYMRACCENNCPNSASLFEQRKGTACGYALILTFTLTLT